MRSAATTTTRPTTTAASGTTATTNTDGVITRQIAIASHGVDGDVAGVRIFTCKTKIDPVVGDDYLDLSFIRGRLSRFWRLLGEFHYWRISPSRFIQ
jgi:hypothetical protein